MTENKVSFGFSLKARKPAFVPVEEPKIVSEEKDFITSVEDKQIKSQNAIKVVDQPIIPLKKANFGIRRISNIHAIANGIETEKPHNSGSQGPCTEDANYEQVPIEKFGMAMLLGMGLKPSEMTRDKK
ncbi:hypothetical protein Ciccas_012296 [Cichlidogyrus casuarinus]|uniref:Spp2/MOS2 G-patch domain-containing protein n=1 Tax=Cichlidogyrus casuarinus TaxID=1844966 RepID=A0ABD2PNT5_9PLAT